MRGRPFETAADRRRRRARRIFGILNSLWFNVLWITLTVTPALSDPISSAIAAFINVVFYAGFTGVTAAEVTAFAIKVAIVVGLSYVSSALSGKKAPGPQGVNGTLQAGGVVPRAFIVGRYATAGSLTYAGTYGTDGDTPNAYYTQVIELSDLPMAALQEIWVGDKKGAYNTGLTAVAQGYPIAEFTADGRANLWVRFHDGSQTTADSFLTATFGSDPDYPFTSGMIGRGAAYVTVTARFNTTEFGGWPSYKFAGTGAKFYDPRLDSTNGGAGSHRFTDQSTWAFTENPIVIVYNILRGVSILSGSHLYGLESLGAARLPTPNWFAAMNECDAVVDDLDGNPAAQYRCGGEISVDTEPAEIISALLMSCNGRITEIGGVYKVLVGAAGSSVFNFTDELIVVDQPQSADPFPSIDQAVNGVLASYVEPLAGWETKELPPRKDDTAIGEDGENFSNVSYALVTDPGQGQRLQTAALNEAQNHRRHTHTFPPSAIVLEPFDVVTWTSGRNGYISKTFFTDAVTISPNLNVPWSGAELDPTDYDWDSGTDGLDMLRPELVPQGPPSKDPPQSLVAVGSVHSIGLSWANPPNIGVQVTEVWRSSTSSIAGAAKIGEESSWGTRYVDGDLATGVTRWYWIRYRRDDDTFSAYTPSSAGAGASATTVEIHGDEITDGSIDAIKFAESINVPHPVPSRAVWTTLYGTPTEGNLLVLTADDGIFTQGELLRFTGGIWTDAVPTIALRGKIVPGQLQPAYQGAALNIDPAPTSLLAWGFSGPAYGITATGGLSAPAGATAFYANANPSGYGFFTEKISVDVNKTYRIHAWWLSDASVNGATYLEIYAYDATGATLPPASIFFIPINGAAASTSWQQVNSSFGAGTANPFPTDTASVAVVGYLNYGGSAGTQFMQDIRLEEVIGTTLIRDDSISTPKLQANSIISSKIAADNVLAAHIAAGNIIAGHLAADAVEAGNIAANAVEAGNIAANAVTSSTIAADSVIAGKLGVGAVNAGVIIVDDIIVTGHLVANSVTVPLIASSGTTIQCNATPTTFTSHTNVTSSAFDGSPVQITVFSDVENPGAAGNQVYGFRILYDGSPIWSKGNASGGPFPVGNNAGSPFCASVGHTPSAGTHTYQVEMCGSSTNVRGIDTSINVLQAKK